MVEVDVDVVVGADSSRYFSILSYSVLLKPPRLAAALGIEFLLFIMHLQLSGWCENSNSRDEIRCKS